MTTEAQREQAERREVLRNDQRVREQGATYFSHTHSDLGGRFALAQDREQIVGESPAPQYPALPASSPWAGPDLVGPEPPLGYSVNALEPSAVSTSPAEPGPAFADAPFAVIPDEQLADVGPSFSDDPASGEPSPASPRGHRVAAGSSPPHHGSSGDDAA